MPSSVLCLAIQYSAPIAKVDKHVHEFHVVVTEAIHLLSTHLMCTSLACGAPCLSPQATLLDIR